MSTLAQDTAAVATRRCLGFRLGGETFGLDIAVVQEICGLPPVTRIPGTSAHIRGVVNLRGRVVPVVDLRVLFGMESVPDTSRTCLVVCRIEGRAEAAVAAAVVDEVSEVMRIGDTTAPPTSAELSGSYVAGLAQLGERVVVLLDAARIFGAGGGTGGTA
ncbi:MAG: chemotaxis protein CheW [Candidatus Latescibacteria bacterium]|nr:chemotaxis protein CheW [Candidatus Latescibacterota bacterium]